MKSTLRENRKSIHKYCGYREIRQVRNTDLPYFYVIETDFLLIFFQKWGNIVLKVEESGGEWYKVVDKFITLWKT